MPLQKASHAQKIRSTEAVLADRHSVWPVTQVGLVAAVIGKAEIFRVSERLDHVTCCRPRTVTSPRLGFTHSNKCTGNMISIDLSGKTAIITGAAQGLGLATARCLHAAGANVIINYYPDASGNQTQLAAQAAEQLGQRALTFGADVRIDAHLNDMFEQAQRSFGGVDILVNNAAILRDKTVKKMSLDDWQSVIDTNLTGVFRASKLAGEMLRDGGRIVNLASISGVIGFFGQANYAAAKAGVIGLTKVLSRELAKRQITVNAVAPGVVLTEMGQSIPEPAREQMLTQIPLGRFGQPEEIAQAILFLCSPLAAYVTGQTLHVNGGWWG